MVYVAQSQALAVLEVLVHLDSPALLEKYAFVLPTNWRDDPAPAEAQATGDDWVKKSLSGALRVPSALVPGECNFLLNPRHADFKNLKTHKATPYQLDPRLSLSTGKDSLGSCEMACSQLAPSALQDQSHSTDQQLRTYSN